MKKYRILFSPWSFLISEFYLKDIEIQPLGLVCIGRKNHGGKGEIGS